MGYILADPTDHLLRVRTLGLPSLEKVVVIPFVSDMPEHAPVDKRFEILRSRERERSSNSVILSLSWDDFLATVPAEQLPSEIQFEQLPFNHPGFILFSSGTTGLPKCIVHSGAGLLLQLKKEHVIHGDMNENDVFFYYTTTGWMMWNWLVAGLSVGCTVVLWDGSPFKPSPSSLWELVDELG